MMEINQHPMIYWQIERILKAKTVDNLIVAISVDPSDDILANFLEGLPVTVYRGSLDNVFSRFFEAASMFKYDSLIRLTGDCPLVMPELIDKMVQEFYLKDVDYLSNTIEPTFPDGLDIEIIRQGTLERLETFTLGSKELEHVTYGIYTRPKEFKLINFRSEINQSDARWTVDYQEDLDFVRVIFNHFCGQESEFTLEEVGRFLDENPQLQSLNQGYLRNEQLHSHRDKG
jgi:spore coat polysaccharide biosynthesis protein SpsF